MTETESSLVEVKLTAIVIFPLFDSLKQDYLVFARVRVGKSVMKCKCAPSGKGGNVKLVKTCGLVKNWGLIAALCVT